VKGAHKAWCCFSRDFVMYLYSVGTVQFVEWFWIAHGCRA